MHIKKQRLLTPGPTPLLPKALHAMMDSDVHHRTEDFRKVYSTVLRDLKEVMGTASSDVLVLVSSGTGAMEAAVQNTLSPGDTVIVCTAGKFGERWVDLTRAYSLTTIVVEAPYGGAVSPVQLDAALRVHPNAKAVLIQASESSTGSMHDLESMGRLIRQTDAIFIVDAITGLGTMPLDIDSWGLDIVVGGSQKAFMVPPGISFLSISPKAWAMSETSRLPRFYFDLKKELKNSVNGESAWTPATSLMFAMAEALTYIKSLGMPKLIENAQLLAKATRAAATALGLELFSSSPGNALTAIKAPEGIDSGVIIKEFRRRFGSIVANGQGSMKDRIFRVAHLGYFDFADLFALIAELELILAANGHPVEFGTGVAAAQRVYAEAALPSRLAVAIS
ncbi:MAG TPA: alanine--glyoxylate aminotransferase family protein [Bryobacteraceae bacterium]|jgi:aspartate aminotransferase-like enzyme